MSFHIGQKVVCVDDRPSSSGYPAPFKKGDVFTVALVKRMWDGVGIDLVELPRASIECGGHTLYNSKRFRPITERKTDISIFKRILADCDQRVDAPCDVEA